MCVGFVCTIFLFVFFLFLFQPTMKCVRHSVNIFSHIAHFNFAFTIVNFDRKIFRYYTVRIEREKHKRFASWAHFIFSIEGERRNEANKGGRGDGGWGGWNRLNKIFNFRCVSGWRYVYVFCIIEMVFSFHCRRILLPLVWHSTKYIFSFCRLLQPHMVVIAFYISTLQMRRRKKRKTTVFFSFFSHNMKHIQINIYNFWYAACRWNMRMASTHVQSNEITVLWHEQIPLKWKIPFKWVNA